MLFYNPVKVSIHAVNVCLPDVLLTCFLTNYILSPCAPPHTQVIHPENLPAVQQPAVYVANHLSFLDIFSLFHLNRPFKFISKTSNFFIPIIGWSMFLTGHIMINRTDKKSQLQCLKQCGVVLSEGASVLFFPEGTRSDDGKMHAFKKGAFSVAAKAKVPVVPITLVNTGDRMPNGHEYLLYPGQVQVCGCQRGRWLVYSLYAHSHHHIHTDYCAFANSTF